MSKVVTISKLEALLSRIRSRAAEPRPAAAAAPVHAAPPAAFAPPPVAAPAPAPPPAMAAPAPPAPAHVAPPAPAPPAAFVPPAPVAPPPVFNPPTAPAFVPYVPAARAAREPDPEPPETTQLDEPTLPPPPLVDAAGDDDFAVDVDVTTGTPVPPAMVAEAQDTTTDSRERLSAAPPVSLESTGPDSADAGPSIEQVAELANEVNEGGIPGDEDEAVGEPPASSRRPVTAPPEERLAELAFGAEEPPPRHTPPPKSGRLPAPPPGEFDPDVTGVRAATAVSADDEIAPVSEQREPSVLSAHAVRPNLGSGPSVHVPDVIGEAQSFAPATFLALLDASLSL